MRWKQYLSFQFYSETNPVVGNLPGADTSLIERGPEEEKPIEDALEEERERVEYYVSQRQR